MLSEMTVSNSGLDALRGSILGTAEDLRDGHLPVREAAARICADSVAYLGLTPPAPALVELLTPFARALFHSDPVDRELRNAAEQLLAAPLDVWPA